MPDGSRIGVWIVGARGSVATTAIVGTAAVGSGIVAPTGMVTAHPPLDSARLPRLESLVFGGHDVVSTPLVKRAEQLAAEGVFPRDLVAGVADRLVAADADIVVAPGDELSPGAVVTRIHDDLTSFRQRHDLDRIVVVNLASTEAPPAWDHAPVDQAEMDAALEDWATCPVSVVSALAAIRSGSAFVDFTPAAATTVPALVAMATYAGVPFVGRDGKTGETLLKTVLAPMFADRSLRVLSWVGTNILGGGDGDRLADPHYAASKLDTKAQALDRMLPNDVHSKVHIDHVPDMGEWKTAWDHVHFEGFLGTRMNLQFTWQGCDSALAAPLVIDLARLAAAALARGVGGPIPELGFFFKDPIGSDDDRLGPQFTALCEWAATL